jgi:hypothetical protein
VVVMGHKLVANDILGLQSTFSLATCLYHVYRRIFAPFCALHGFAQKHTSLHVLPSKIKN